MAGFGKITFVGEYYNQSIVNVLWYRSNVLNPWGNNPFEDMLNVIDAVLDAMKTEYLQVHTADYTLLRAEGVGYDNVMEPVTPSPAFRTINESGTFNSPSTVGAALSCNLSFMLGQQVQILGQGHSKRNRGYLSIGPLPEAHVDNYSHISASFLGDLDSFAQKVDDVLVDVWQGVSFTPIRIHAKAGFLFTQNSSYSDILGYKLPSVASFRRSRIPEA